MDGLINLYKPIGISSAKALYRVRGITGQRKSGHAGTLDPAAEGVLLLCLGRGTKLVEQLMELPKVYRTTARLDVTSDSFDSEQLTSPVSVSQVPDITQVASVIRELEGLIQQVPPAISAIKVGGQPAYKLARTGQPPKLQPRPVRIYWIHLHRYEWPQLDIEVACGRGTYIRALIRDIGARLDTGGCLTSLVRLAVGPFLARDSRTFAQLEAAGGLESGMMALERVRGLLAEQPVPVPERPHVGRR